MFDDRNINPAPFRFDVPFPFASVDSTRIWANLEFLLKSLNGSVNFVTQLLVELPSISIYLTVMAHELFVTHKFANKM